MVWASQTPPESGVSLRPAPLNDAEIKVLGRFYGVTSHHHLFELCRGSGGWPGALIQALQPTASPERSPEQSIDAFLRVLSFLPRGVPQLFVEALPVEDELLQRLSVEDAVRSLNPGAKVIRALRGDVPLSSVLRTGLFDMKKASTSAGWMQQWKGVEVVPETEEYGIHSFVYKARTPFHPLRLMNFFTDILFVNCRDGICSPLGPPKGEEPMSRDEKPKTDAHEYQLKRDRMLEKFGHILRSKGCMWLAGRDHLIGGWEQAGSIGEFDCAGPWMAFLPKEKWPPLNSAPGLRLVQQSDGPVLMGRRQELVFIGQQLKRDAITKALDACLLVKDDLMAPSTPLLPTIGEEDGDLSNREKEEWTKHGWKLGVNYLDDPFPRWPDEKEFAKMIGIA